MKNCPVCGAQLQDDARFCVRCASQIDEKTPVLLKEYGRNRKKTFRLAALCLAVLLSLTAVTAGAASAKRGRAVSVTDPETDTGVTVNETIQPTPDTSEDTGSEVTGTHSDEETAASETKTERETDTATGTETVPETETETVTAAPETTVPITTAPETTVPTTVPETTVPETTAPTTTAPETTAPTTTAPETTADEITTALETEGEESSVQIQTPGIAIVSADSFAGGPPENEEEMLTKQYLFAERSRFGDWVERIFGYDNPEIGSTVQLEDLVMPDRVYFSDGGNAVVTARLYTDGTDVDFRMLKYSVGMDQADTSFEDHVRENSGIKRPAGWRGLMTEAGIDVDTYSEDEMAKQYPEATGIRPVSYEYWVTYLTGADRTIKVTIEKRVGKILPEGGYETSAWWYPDVTDWFTLAEYVD